MYSEYECPVISSSLFYYDIEYREETAERVITVLKENGMFPPDKIHADELTRNRYINVNKDVENMIIRAYSQKNIFGIDMSSGNSQLVSDFWRVNWGLTYYKNEKIVGSSKFLPWNVLTIQSTHSRLQNISDHNNFIACIKDLIKCIHPFYVSIDDLANKIKLQDKSNETHFIPNNLRTIYWGNYLGEMYAEKFGLEHLLAIPSCNKEQLINGVFFTLSDSALDFDSKDVSILRRQIKKYLGLP